MPNSGSDDSLEWPVPAGAKTSFPSLTDWEDPWERKIDLATLRVNAKTFIAVRRLIENGEKGGRALAINAALLAPQLQTLSLDEARASRLLEDAMLVCDWYLHPQRLAHLHMDQAEARQALGEMSKPALRLYNLLDLTAREVEEIIRAMPSEICPGAEDIDLLRFTREAGILARAASEAAKLLRPGHGGRKNEQRRDIAIALITWATEQATTRKVSTSDGTKQRRGFHFARADGAFVFCVLNLLTGKNERQLVKIFRRLRTKPSKQSDQK